VVTVPRRLVRAMTEYMTRYSDDAGPTFPAGRYLRTPDPAVSTLDVLESFALSARLSLAAIGFCRVLRPQLTRPANIRETQELEDLATFRLTCAMVGLVRSFAVNAFDDDSAPGENLRRTVAQRHRDGRAVLAELERALADVRAGLNEATIGVRADTVDFDQRFECGWSWATVEGTAPIELAGRLAPERLAMAVAAPHPYFSWVAGDVVEALYSERTRLLGLLNEDQQRLAQALRLRLDLTRAYWARLATFGDDRWPLERIPWRTTSGEEADHHSLAVAAMTIAEVGDRRGNTDVAFGHLTRVLGRLARRHGIVRPPRADGAPDREGLASEPLPVALEKGGPDVAYVLPGFAPLLLNAAVRARLGTRHEQLRGDLEELADLVWDHIAEPGDEWPPEGLLRSDGDGPDWHNVLCVVDAMTRAMTFAEGGQGRAESPLSFVQPVLTAAEELVEGLAPVDAARVADRLDRARRLVDDQPARAAALLYQLIAELDAISATPEEPA